MLAVLSSLALRSEPMFTARAGMPVVLYGQGHTLLTISAFAGQKCINREGEEVLAVQMLLDRPQGQAAPAADVYVPLIPLFIARARCLTADVGHDSACVHLYLGVLHAGRPL